MNLQSPLQRKTATSSPADLRKALRTDPRLREELVDYLVKTEGYDNCDAAPFVEEIAKSDPSRPLSPEMADWVEGFWKIQESTAELASRQRDAIEKQRRIDYASRVATSARAALEVERKKIETLDASITAAKEFYMAQVSGIPASTPINPPEVLGPMKNILAAERAKEFINSYVIPQIEDAIRTADATLAELPKKKRAS